MQVILKENVENLGQTGDIVRVSSGYARNFLLPNGLVALANERNLAQVEHQKRVLERKRAAEKGNALELAKKIEAFSCTITRKVGKNDKLFGSVTPSDIIEELLKAGLQVNKGSVVLKEPLKSLGVHTVGVRIQQDVTAQLKVWVAKEEN